MKRGSNKQQGQKGAIRIISGQWRGRKLPVLNAEGLRPTTDRNKEMLFNWLMQDVRDATVLDLFAGSGGLGMEALSRYASFVTFIEKDKTAAKQLSRNLNTLNVDSSIAQVVQGDALNSLAGLTQQYSLVFIDPPFQHSLVPKAISALATHDVLAPDALIYVECEKAAENYSVPDGWRCIKEKSSPQVNVRLFISEVD